MNVATAKRIGAGKLVFGSAEQIEAVYVLALYTRLKEENKIPACEKCRGDGNIRCGECGNVVDCPRCLGEGLMDEESLNRLEPDQMLAYLSIEIAP